MQDISALNALHKSCQELLRRNKNRGKRVLLQGTMNHFQNHVMKEAAIGLMEKKSGNGFNIRDIVINNYNVNNYNPLLNTGNNEEDLAMKEALVKFLECREEKLDPQQYLSFTSVAKLLGFSGTATLKCVNWSTDFWYKFTGIIVNLGKMPVALIIIVVFVTICKVALDFGFWMHSLFRSLGFSTSSGDTEYLGIIDYMALKVLQYLSEWSLIVDFMEIFLGLRTEYGSQTIFG
jgi:hypothetical protein